MKNLFVLLTILLIANSASAERDPSRVKISPSRPRVGQTVMIVYDSEAAPATMKNAGAVDVDVLTVTKDEFPDGDLREIPMTKTGKVWKASVPVSDPASKLLVFRFVSGNSVDDDNDNAWSVMIHDAKGRPVRGAHFAESALYNYGIGSFKRKTDPVAADRELSRETSLYPDNWFACSFRWQTMLSRIPRDSLRSRIEPVLDRFAARDKNNDSLLARYPWWYQMIGDTAKATELRAYGISRSPKGRVAQEARMNEVLEFRDPAERLRLEQQMMTEFPPLDSASRDERYTMLAITGMRARQFDVAADAVTKVSRASPNLCMQISDALLKVGGKEGMAETLALRALALASSRDPASRKNFKTEKEWREFAGDQKAAALAQLGEVYQKEGKIDKRVDVLDQAYAESRGEDAEIGQEYVHALVEATKYQKALEVSTEIMGKGKGTEALLEEAKLAYAGKENTGSFDSLSADQKRVFEGEVATARSKGVATIRASVAKSRINQPGIDFTLNDTEGKPVRLSSLHGRVVVVDFWATWCGPCKRSFPYLQKVYEKYQDNPSVAIFTVDCWERLKSWEATATNAKKFREENKYTWPILVDDKDDVVSKYGVDGIPTKFIIDRNGSIAFKSIGFNGAEMEEELTQQIELLLAEPAGSPQ